MFGILPASGLAKRLGGIPKFALPCDELSSSLLEYHVRLMKPYVEKVIVVTRSRWVPFISELGLDVVIIEKEPSTMSDAVKYASLKFESNQYLIGMPDTYFEGENPYSKLADLPSTLDVALACWEVTLELKGRVGQVEINNSNFQITNIMDKVSNCNFEYIWGVMKISSKFMNDMDSKNSHPGIDLEKLLNEYTQNSRAVILKGRYFDVGTFNGYCELLNRILYLKITNSLIT